MNNRMVAVSLVLFILVSLIVGCTSQTSHSVENVQSSDDVSNTGPAQSPEEPASDEVSKAELDGEMLVEARCTTCHGLAKVESAGMAEAEWKSTVERMVSKGADLSAEEQAAVIEYLTVTYP